MTSALTAAIGGGNMNKKSRSGVGKLIGIGASAAKMAQAMA